MESTVARETQETYLNDASSDIACIKAKILKAIEILEHEHYAQSNVPMDSCSSNERAERSEFTRYSDSVSWDIPNGDPPSFHANKSSQDQGSKSSASQEFMVSPNLSCTNPIDYQNHEKELLAIVHAHDNEGQEICCMDFCYKACIFQISGYHNKICNENMNKKYGIYENDRKHTACKSCNVSSYISHVVEINKFIKSLKAVKQNGCRHGITLASKQYRRPNKENRIKNQNITDATSSYHKCYLNEITQSKAKHKDRSIIEMPSYKNVRGQANKTYYDKTCCKGSPFDTFSSYDRYHHKITPGTTCKNYKGFNRDTQTVNISEPCNFRKTNRSKSLYYQIKPVNEKNFLNCMLVRGKVDGLSKRHIEENNKTKRKGHKTKQNATSNHSKCYIQEILERFQLPKFINNGHIISNNHSNDSRHSVYNIKKSADTKNNCLFSRWKDGNSQYSNDNDLSNTTHSRYKHLQKSNITKMSDKFLNLPGFTNTYEFQNLNENSTAYQWNDSINKDYREVKQSPQFPNATCITKDYRNNLDVDKPNNIKESKSYNKTSQGRRKNELLDFNKMTEQSKTEFSKYPGMINCKLSENSRDVWCENISVERKPSHRTKSKAKATSYILETTMIPDNFADIKSKDFCQIINPGFEKSYSVNCTGSKDLPSCDIKYSLQESKLKSKEKSEILNNTENILCQTISSRTLLGPNHNMNDLAPCHGEQHTLRGSQSSLLNLVTSWLRKRIKKKRDKNMLLDVPDDQPCVTNRDKNNFGVKANQKSSRSCGTNEVIVPNLNRFQSTNEPELEYIGKLITATEDSPTDIIKKIKDYNCSNVEVLTNYGKNLYSAFKHKPESQKNNSSEFRNKIFKTCRECGIGTENTLDRNENELKRTNKGLLTKVDIELVTSENTQTVTSFDSALRLFKLQNKLKSVGCGTDQSHSSDYYAYLNICQNWLQPIIYEDIGVTTINKVDVAVTTESSINNYIRNINAENQTALNVNHDVYVSSLDIRNDIGLSTINKHLKVLENESITSFVNPFTRKKKYKNTGSCTTSLLHETCDMSCNRENYHKHLKNRSHKCCGTHKLNYDEDYFENPVKLDVKLATSFSNCHINGKICHNCSTCLRKNVGHNTNNNPANQHKCISKFTNGERRSDLICCSHCCEPIGNCTKISKFPKCVSRACACDMICNNSTETVHACTGVRAISKEIFVNNEIFPMIFPKIKHNDVGSLIQVKSEESIPKNNKYVTLKNNNNNTLKKDVMTSTADSRRTESGISKRCDNCDQFVECIKSIIEKYTNNSVPSKIYCELFQKPDKCLKYDKTHISGLGSLADNYVFGINNLSKKISTPSSTLTEESARLTAVTPMNSEKKIILDTSIHTHETKFEKQSLDNTVNNIPERLKNQRKKETKGGNILDACNRRKEDCSVTYEGVQNSSKFKAQATSFPELSRNGAFQKSSYTPKLSDTKHLVLETCSNHLSKTIFQQRPAIDRCIYKTFDEYLDAVTVTRQEVACQCETASNCNIKTSKSSISVPRISYCGVFNRYENCCKIKRMERNCFCNRGINCSPCRKYVKGTCDFSCQSNELYNMSCMCPNTAEKSTGVKTKPRSKNKIYYKINKKIVDIGTKMSDDNIKRKYYTDRSTKTSDENNYTDRGVITSKQKFVKKSFTDRGVKTSDESIKNKIYYKINKKIVDIGTKMSDDNIKRKYYTDRSTKTSDENNYTDRGVITSKEKFVKKSFTDRGVKTSDESIKNKYYADKNITTSEERIEKKLFTDKGTKTSGEYFKKICCSNKATKMNEKCCVIGGRSSEKNIKENFMTKKESQDRENIFNRIKKKIIDMGTKTSIGNNICKFVIDRSIKSTGNMQRSAESTKRCQVMESQSQKVKRCVKLYKAKSSFCWKLSEYAKNDKIFPENSKLLSKRHQKNYLFLKKHALSGELCKSFEKRQNQDKYLKFYNHEETCRKTQRASKSEHLNISCKNNKSLHSRENLNSYKCSQMHRQDNSIRPFSQEHLAQIDQLRQDFLEYDKLCQPNRIKIGNNDIMCQQYSRKKDTTNANTNLKLQKKNIHINYKSKSMSKIKRNKCVSNKPKNIERSVHKCIKFSGSSKANYKLSKNKEVCPNIQFYNVVRKSKICPPTPKVFGLNKLRCLCDDIKNFDLFTAEDNENKTMNLIFNEFECNHNDTDYYQNELYPDIKPLPQSQLKPKSPRTEEREEYQNMPNSWPYAVRQSEFEQLNKSTSMHWLKKVPGNNISIQAQSSRAYFPFVRQNVQYQNPCKRLNKSIQTSTKQKLVKSVTYKKRNKKTNDKSCQMHHYNKKTSCSQKNTTNNKKPANNLMETHTERNGFSYYKHGKKNVFRGDYERRGKLYKTVPVSNRTENSSVTVLFSKNEQDFEQFSSDPSDLSIKRSTSNNCENLTENYKNNYYSQIPYDYPKKDNKSASIKFEENSSYVYVPKKSLSFDMYHQDKSDRFQFNSRLIRQSEGKKCSAMPKNKVNPCDKKLVYDKIRKSDPSCLTSTENASNGKMDWFCNSKKLMKRLLTNCKINNANNTIKIPLNDHQDMKITIHTRKENRIKSNIVTPDFRNIIKQNTTFGSCNSCSVNKSRLNKYDVKSRKVQSCLYYNELKCNEKQNSKVMKNKTTPKLSYHKPIPYILFKSQNNNLHTNKTQTDDLVTNRRYIQSYVMNETKLTQTPRNKAKNFFQKIMFPIYSKESNLRYSRSCNNTSKQNRVNKLIYKDVMQKMLLINKPCLDSCSQSAINKKKSQKNAKSDRKRNITYTVQGYKHNISSHLDIKQKMVGTQAIIDKRKKRMKNTKVCKQEPPSKKVLLTLNEDWLPLVTENNACTKKHCNTRKKIKFVYRSPYENDQHVKPCKICKKKRGSECKLVNINHGDGPCKKYMELLCHNSNNSHRTNDIILRCKAAPKACIYLKPSKSSKPTFEKCEFSGQRQSYKNKLKSLFHKLFFRCSETEPEQVELACKGDSNSKTRCPNVSRYRGWRPSSSCQDQNGLLKIFSRCRSQQLKSCKACKPSNSCKQCRPDKLCNTCLHSQLENTCNYKELLSQPNLFLTVRQLRKRVCGCCLNGFSFLFWMPMLFCLVIVKCITCSLCN